MGTEVLVAKFISLAERLIEMIQSGQFVFGERIASIRQLAQSHQVSKNTVIKALVELERLGYVEARSRQGFFVCWRYEGQTEAQPATIVSAMPKAVNLSTVFHTLMERGAAFDCYPSAKEKYVSPYLPSLLQCINRNHKSALAELSGYYDEPQGNLALRVQIAHRYRQRGTLVDASDVVVTSGCQNALFLALNTVTSPGDTVAVESPAFYGVLQLLEQLGLKVIEIPMLPQGGMDIERLESISRNHRIAAAVVTPTYATPTGRSMPEQNKQALLELAELRDFFVVEDDIYGEMGLLQQTSPLFQLDIYNRVILCGSMSKCLSRDLRVGWLISPRFQHQILRQKLGSQLASAQSVQLGLAEFMAKGDFRRHLNHFRKYLLLQRNLLLSELKSYWPSSVSYVMPEGGLTLWLRMPEHIDSQALYQQMLQNQVVLTPGLLFASDHRFNNYIRLSYHQPLQGERLQALRRAASFVKQLLAAKDASS